MTGIQLIKTLGNIKLKYKLLLHRQSGAGFTLIELLIVAAVFSVAALLATTVFSNVQTTQRQVQGQQRISTDGRYILETIARSVRTGRINYAYYPTNGFSNPYEILSLIDDQNIVTCYHKGVFLSGRQVIQVLTPANPDCTSLDSSVWQTITPEDLQVDAFWVYINPRSNPFLPPPSQASDCRDSARYQSSSGTCSCQFPNAGNQCWLDQSCVSIESPRLGLFCSSDIEKCICQNAPIQPQVTIYLKTSSTNTAPGEQASVTLQTTVVSRVYQR